VGYSQVATDIARAVAQGRCIGLPHARASRMVGHQRRVVR